MLASGSDSDMEAACAGKGSQLPWWLHQGQRDSVGGIFTKSKLLEAGRSTQWKEWNSLAVGGNEGRVQMQELASGRSRRRGRRERWSLCSGVTARLRPHWSSLLADSLNLSTLGDDGNAM